MIQIILIHGQLVNYQPTLMEHMMNKVSHPISTFKKIVHHKRRMEILPRHPSQVLYPQPNNHHVKFIQLPNQPVKFIQHQYPYTQHQKELNNPMFIHHQNHSFNHLHHLLYQYLINHNKLFQIILLPQYHSTKLSLMNHQAQMSN